MVFFSYLTYVRASILFVLLWCIKKIIHCIVKIILVYCFFELLMHYVFIFFFYNLLCYRIPNPISVNGNNRTCKTQCFLRDLVRIVVFNSHVSELINIGTRYLCAKRLRVRSILYPLWVCKGVKCEVIIKKRKKRGPKREG